MSEAHAVILAGGSGTRFWPASRRELPKQFLAATSGSSESLIAATVRRIAPLAPASRVLIATGTHLIGPTRAALPEVPSSAILGEPMQRNTAACIGWATSIIARTHPDALVMVLPSDHYIAQEAAFRATLERALASASSGVLTTIGITPTRPETGYGYIELGDALEAGLHRVARFVEKPKLQVAEQYLRGGKHLWNSGMFFFRASAMLEAIARHLPDLSAGLERITRASGRGAEDERRETLAVFESLASISIDYGVMEKESPLNVITGDFGWNDVGSWESVWELSEKDADGNAAPPGSVLVDSQGNLVRDLRKTGASKTIALVGVEDLCVIETDDVLLVIPRARAQDAKLAVEALNGRGDTKFT